MVLAEQACRHEFNLCSPPKEKKKKTDATSSGEDTCLQTYNHLSSISKPHMVE